MEVHGKKRKVCLEDDNILKLDARKSLDSCYFNAYEDLGVHRSMIEDQTRTTTYRYALMKNYPLIRSKRVMDVGAGTGILSIFIAKAGAEKVFAVEGSEMAKWAVKVVEENHLQAKISVINERLEDISAEFCGKVDVIVSEWMGYALLHESMLKSVIIARNRFLKQGGQMFPNKARLYLAPIAHPDREDQFWSEVPQKLYEVSMSCLQELENKSAFNQILIDCVQIEDIIAQPSIIVSIDLESIDVLHTENLKGNFSFSCFGHRKFSGFAIWFDVEFPSNITLTTSPYEKTTHWYQSLISVDPVNVEQDSVISGHLSLEFAAEDKRSLVTNLSYAVDGAEVKSYSYKMSS